MRTTCPFRRPEHESSCGFSIARRYGDFLTMEKHTVGTYFIKRLSTNIKNHKRNLENNINVLTLVV